MAREDPLRRKHLEGTSPLQKAQHSDLSVPTSPRAVPCSPIGLWSVTWHPHLRKRKFAPNQDSHSPDEAKVLAGPHVYPQHHPNLRGFFSLMDGIHLRRRSWGGLGCSHGLRVSSHHTEQEFAALKGHDGPYSLVVPDLAEAPLWEPSSQKFPDFYPQQLLQPCSQEFETSSSEEFPKLQGPPFCSRGGQTTWPSPCHYRALQSRMWLTLRTALRRRKLERESLMSPLFGKWCGGNQTIEEQCCEVCNGGWGGDAPAVEEDKTVATKKGKEEEEGGGEEGDGEEEGCGAEEPWLCEFLSELKARKEAAQAEANAKVAAARGDDCWRQGIVERALSLGIKLPLSSICEETEDEVLSQRDASSLRWTSAF